MNAGRRALSWRLLLILAPLLAPQGLLGDEPFFLKGGERIVFFGDSITQGGLYVDYVEAFLLTRFPDKRFTLINHGISSETISGTSETDHLPRRPHALPRFTRDVANWRPEVVVACFGMNDGNYHPFDDARFAKYKTGVRALIERTRDEAGARLVLLTPPPFDPYRRTVVDPNAKEFGYKYPAVDYDRTLESYSRWLLTLRSDKIVVADVHAAMAEHLARRREQRVSFALADDGVHPNATGHWLMAQTLLLAWHAPALCAEARIDAKGLKAETGEIRDLRREGDSVEATWHAPLPMPYDPAWDPQSIALEDVSHRLNRYRLSVVGLDAPRYRLRARFAEDSEDIEVGEFARDDLAKGLDVTTLTKFPTVSLSRQVLTLVQQRRKAEYDRWRKQIAAPRTIEAPAPMSEDDDPSRKIRRLSQPRQVRLRLVPVEGR
jgi:lysophospholipase L1-like esterase